MHLASASLTPTVGLFSRPKLLMPYNNDSTAINTNSVQTETSIKIIRACKTVITTEIKQFTYFELLLTPSKVHFNSSKV
jgi:ADP-heptose:LPS heptosyltransferase